MRSTREQIRLLAGEVSLLADDLCTLLDAGMVEGAAITGYALGITARELLERLDAIAFDVSEPPDRGAHDRLRAVFGGAPNST